MATYGRDFFGRWIVLVGNRCIGVYPNAEEARMARDKWNAEHQ